MGRLISFSAGCVTANLPSFCPPHSWSLIRHCARTLAVATLCASILRLQSDKNSGPQHHTCHVSRMWSRWTNVLRHLTSSPCLAVDCPIAWQHEISWPELAQCCTWGGEEEIWSRWCLNRFLGDGEQWLMGARINIYNSFSADRVSQKTMCWISINKGIMTLHVVWRALGTRVFPTYFKVAQAHFSPPLLHAITI